MIIVVFGLENSKLTSYTTLKKLNIKHVSTVKDMSSHRANVLSLVIFQESPQEIFKKHSLPLTE